QQVLPDSQQLQLQLIAVDQVVEQSHRYIGTINGKHMVKQGERVLTLSSSEYQQFVAGEKALAMHQVRMLSRSGSDAPGPAAGPTALTDPANVINLLRQLPPPTLSEDPTLPGPVVLKVGDPEAQALAGAPGASGDQK